MPFIVTIDGVYFKGNIVCLPVIDKRFVMICQ